MCPCGTADGPHALLGQSDAVTRLRATIATVARLPVPVLVSGEDGTGRSRVARCIHAASDAAAGTFAAVDCREAGTSAEEALTAAFASIAARAGPATVYLGAVDALPADRQARLCRLLAPPGASGAPNPVRVVAGTSADLPAMAGRGAFLPDLFYALAVARLHTPPLRRIPEDVPVLLAHLAAAEAGRYGRAVPDFEARLPHLLSHGWPGNVPELRNYAVRLVLGLDDDVPLDRAEGALAEQVAWFERQVIARRLAASGGDVQDACRRLAVSRTTLYEKINRHGLRAGDAQRAPGPRGRRPLGASERAAPEIRALPPRRAAAGHGSGPVL